MVAVVVIEFSGMRCQPLRRALADKGWECNLSRKTMKVKNLDRWVDNNMTLTSIIIMVVGLTMGYVLF